MKYNSLIEQRVAEAIKEGEFDDLPGKGKPLEIDLNMPQGVRMYLRALEGAGVTPPEVQTLKEFNQLKESAQTESDPVKKKELIAKMAKLEPEVRSAIERMKDMME